MHGVRQTLLEAQAEAAGLPLLKIPIPYPCPNTAYEAAIREAMRQARAEGIGQVIFGDLFLDDIRRYRENQLADTGLTPVFPLWGLDTAALARDMVEGGLRAYLTCVDPKRLDKGWAGQVFDAGLLSRLPAGVDPCGENGEFHTFACAGPMFQSTCRVPGSEAHRVVRYNVSQRSDHGDDDGSRSRG